MLKNVLNSPDEKDFHQDLSEVIDGPLFWTFHKYVCSDFRKERRNWFDYNHRAWPGREGTMTDSGRLDSIWKLNQLICYMIVWRVMDSDVDDGASEGSDKRLGALFFCRHYTSTTAPQCPRGMFCFWAKTFQFSHFHSLLLLHSLHRC